MKIAFVTAGGLPCPPVQGGAVENIVHMLVKQNELLRECQMVVYSTYNAEAETEAAFFKSTQFVFVRPSRLAEQMDHMIHFIAKNILRINKHLSFRFVFRRLHYLRQTAKHLKTNPADKLVLETPANYFVLKQCGNRKRYHGNTLLHLHNRMFIMPGCQKQTLETWRFLAVSHYISCDIQEISGVSKDKIRVLQNAVDIQNFACKNPAKQQNLRACFEILPDQRVVLFAGRLTKEKGICQAIEGFREANLPNTVLCIVGKHFYASNVESDFEKKLQSSVETLGRKVCFTGYVPYEDMPSVYGMADVALLPSIWDEPCGLTMIEAMAAGLPLITTNSGGIPEYATAGAAIILPRDDQLVAAISASLKKVMADATLRERMGQQGQKAVAALTPENYYKNFCQYIFES